jgi:CRP-like cAMP-binding protein
MSTTPTRRDFEVAKNCPFVRFLPEREAKLLLDSAVSHSFKRGELLFRQNDPSHTVWILVKGWVRLYRTTEHGSVADVGLLPAGQDLAGGTAIVGGVCPVSAEAATACTALTMEHTAFRQHFSTNPEVVVALLKTAYHKANQMLEHIEHLKIRSGAQRVAAFLLALCPKEGEKVEVTLPYNKIYIAGSLGMKRESLSRAFSRLVEQGVVVRNNVACISSVAALSKFVHRDPAESWARDKPY